MVERCSSRMFWPSIQPSSCNASRKTLRRLCIAGSSANPPNHTTTSQAKFDRAVRDTENDRNGRGRCFGRDRAIGKAGRGNHRTRRRIKSAISPGRRLYWPAIRWYSTLAFLAFEEARFSEALAKCVRISWRVVCGRTIDESDHRHRRLLCRCRERPRDRRAKQADELPPPHAGHGLPPRCRRR